MKALVTAAVCALTGCATTAAPSAQYFTGDPYNLVARHDVIAGEVCGVPVHYAITRQHDATVLLGAGSRRLSIRDEHGARHVIAIEANGGVSAEPVVDVWIGADRIEGHVGGRAFALEADGDAYRGTYVMPGTSSDERGELDVAGRGELLQMPRAELAAVVGPLLSCDRRGWTR
ncbi:MAG TPA: hypothetical protein VGL86_27780, partial [Polyangia bacterium]